MLTGRAASFRAHLRSLSGLMLSHTPTAPEHTVPPHLFRVLLLERLALPLPVNEARCDGCHEQLDTLGRHLAACPRTRRLAEAGENLPGSRSTRQIQRVPQGHECPCPGRRRTSH